MFAAIHNKRFVKANAGFVVFVLRQFCVENLLNKTPSASNLVGHGHGHGHGLFCFSHDLVPKVCNFFKITLLRGVLRVVAHAESAARLVPFSTDQNFPAS